MARKTVLGKVREAIADAAVEVIEAADKHVVHPVGEKLGLIDATETEPEATPEEVVATPKPKSAKSRLMTKGLPGTRPSTKSSHEPENRTGRSR